MRLNTAAKELIGMNGKSFTLDTNIVIALFGEDEVVITKIEKSSAIYIPIIVLGELLYGAELSTKKTENIKKLNSFSKSCNILYLNYRTASEYARIKSGLKKAGTPIPENDIWIAALSIENNITLATRDKHFNFIKDIKIEHW